MAINANVLATAGTNIGQQIGKATEQFGQNIGGMLTDVGRGFSERRSSREAQQLLQQYANDPAQLNALGQKYAMEGNDALSKVFFEAAKQATAAQEKRTSATIGRGKGELMALANDPAFDLNDAKMRSGYIGMADSFGVSRADAIQIALDARKERQGGDKQTFASAGRYKDQKNNIYTATEVRTKGGGVTIDYSPITPGAPEQPEGKLTPVGGAYGLTAGERVGMEEETAGRTTKAEGFAKSQQEAVDSLPKIEVAIGNAEQSLELLTKIKTGGFTTAVVIAAQRFLGEEPRTQAEFNLLAGKTVLDNLSKFEGAISEGERMYLERLYQSLERSGGANQGILESLLQEAQFYLADAKAKANASSYKDYLDNRPTYSSVVARQEDKKEGPQKVNFGDLK